jgi:hypothetical protein
MKVCVVGNGPSAKGKGSVIDACDFVVRIKQYWTFGAEGVGDKIDAWAWYGAAVATEKAPVACEHWITQSMYEYAQREWKHDDGAIRLERITSLRRDGVLRFIHHNVVCDLSQHLGAFASTGLRAIAMALTTQPDELVIAGFDAIADDDMDARDGQHRPPCHDMRAEKRLLCELEDGRWLGEPSRTRLRWLDPPMVLERKHRPC